MWAWLLAAAAPLAIRVIVGLGFSVVSFTGVTVAANSLMSIAQSNWAGLPLFTLQIAELSGVPECLGMIAGAYMGKLAVWSAMNAAKYVLRSS